jgi:hypothetical protein
LSIVSSAPPLLGLSLNARSAAASCRLPCCREGLLKGRWCCCPESGLLAHCMVAVVLLVLLLQILSTKLTIGSVNALCCTFGIDLRDLI